MRKRRSKLETVQEFVIQGYRNGGTLRELAQTYNVAPNTIKGLLGKRGELMRPPGRRKKKPEGGLSGNLEQAQESDTVHPQG